MTGPNHVLDMRQRKHVYMATPFKTALAKTTNQALDTKSKTKGLWLCTKECPGGPGQDPIGGLGFKVCDGGDGGLLREFAQDLVFGPTVDCRTQGICLGMEPGDDTEPRGYTPTARMREVGPLATT